ncbi:hypothetical protein MPER_14866, partial [Moniliophthora perniciosa FA553]
EAVYLTNNVVADSLLVYRLFVVWGKKKRIIIGPVILLVATIGREEAIIARLSVLIRT